MKKVIFACFVLIFGLISVASAATTMKLTKNTELHPQGWISGSLLFLSGTDVTLNSDGEVVSGTTVHDCFLPTVGITMFLSVPVPMGAITMNYNMANFRGGGGITIDASPITFNEQGKVISGTLGDITCIKLTPNSTEYVDFRPNKIIIFNTDGTVAQGTIQDETSLRPIGWRNILPIDASAGFLKFDSGTEVLFGPGGQVTLGIISKTFTTLSKKTFKAGTPLHFNENADPEIVQPHPNYFFKFSQ